MHFKPSSSTGVAITNPLVLYRALVATKRIDPDPAQHRLALHLQKLYEQLKDYEPIVQYGYRLQQLTRVLGQTAHQQKVTGGNISRGNGGSRGGILSSFLGNGRDKSTLAMTRVLTDREAAAELDSPKGLMLHGEVGTGKSMLIDLFADCLPNSKKKRWHFTTFMLETLSKLEQLRRSRQAIIPGSLGQEDEYTLLWLARDMISKSPILFLDEFQLPDRASSKLMANLMTSFFHLGGVLIATSNRMPEELAKAAGIELTSPSSEMASTGWKFSLRKHLFSDKREQLYSGQSEFAGFLEVIRARCEIWEMEGRKDYRRRDVKDSFQPREETLDATPSSSDGFEGLEPMTVGNIGLGFEQSVNAKPPTKDDAKLDTMLPKHFFVKHSSENFNQTESWAKACQAAMPTSCKEDATVPFSPISWSKDVIQVYGRNLAVPRHYEGVTLWTFNELCTCTLGPADYLSLASRYHTMILSDVPILTLLMKNEARRFITLLDALYETRCKLLMSAEAGPDDLFFPEMLGSLSNDSTTTSSASIKSESIDDAVYPETFSEMYQDAVAPFRPNVAMYQLSQSELDYPHARFQGILSEDQLEDDPPNKIRRGNSTHGFDQEIVRTGPNFAQTARFTGEDERFAYKRAKSRLWEMCGAKWWARNEVGWWRPLDESVRHWEKRTVAEVPQPHRTKSDAESSHGAAIGPIRDIDEKDDEVLFRYGATSPFRTHRDPPPKFSWTHIWGTMKWGKKAGPWGQGVEGLKDRAKKS